METRASRKILLAVLFAIIGQFCFAQSKVPSTPEEKRAAFLTPEYYTNWLGASFFTIPTVEKEFDVTPTKILDLTFFYDFGDCLVGMESNEKGVVVQMTIRLFADQATDFIQKVCTSVRTTGCSCFMRNEFLLAPRTDSSISMLLLMLFLLISPIFLYNSVKSRKMA